MFTLRTSTADYHCKKLVLGVGVPETKRLLGRLGVRCSKVIDHRPLQIAAFGRRKNTNLVETTDQSSPIVEIAMRETSITSVYDPHAISQKGLEKVINSKIALFLLNRLDVFGFRCFLLQYWSEALKGDEKAGNCLLSNALTVSRICKSLDLVPFFFRYTKYGRGFHYQMTAEVDDLTQLCLLGGAAAKKLPFYHPSFMFMLNSFIVSKIAAG